MLFCLNILKENCSQWTYYPMPLWYLQVRCWLLLFSSVGNIVTSQPVARVSITPCPCGIFRWDVGYYSLAQLVTLSPPSQWPRLDSQCGNLVLLHSEQKCLDVDWFTHDYKMGRQYPHEILQWYRMVWIYGKIDCFGSWIWVNGIRYVNCSSSVFIIQN